MTAPVATVAQNLTVISELYEALLVQAIHKANDSLMPGGEAMVALAHVGSPEVWDRRVSLTEERHYATCTRLDHTRCRFSLAEDDEGEAPLQTLLFWTEAYREQHGYPLEARPTMGSEVRFLRWALEWAWDNETQWDDLAADVAKVRTRIENLLLAGVRAERGVPCLYEDCRGARLSRKLAPKRDAEGRKVWEFTDWRCARCERTWSADAYAQMVTAAHEATKFEDIDGDTWCTPEYAARKTSRSVKTIRTWANRGEVGVVCIVSGRRVGFVRLADVEERHALAKTRKRIPAA